MSKGTRMASLPYMQLYVADYLADTYHLTTEEHGAYFLMLMNYWQTAKPLKSERIASLVRMDKESFAEIEPTLKEFFTVNENGDWVHDRIQADLKGALDKSVKATESAKKRWAKKALNNEPKKDGNANASANVEETQSPKSRVNESKVNQTKEDTKDIIIEVVEEKSLAEKTIDYLNQQTGKGYQYADAHLKLINARIKDGATEEQLAYVIDVKVKEWVNNAEFKKYLRPSTLFAPSKFDTYLNQDMTVTKEDEIDYYLNNNIYETIDSIAEITAKENQELLNG